MTIKTWYDQHGVKRRNKTPDSDRPACGTIIRFGNQISAIATPGAKLQSYASGGYGFDFVEARP